MSEQLIAILKKELDELAVYHDIDTETLRNKLKEILQLYILNFIYHNPEYSKWIMYGGSALRIIHGIDRMSVDLDFEVPRPITAEFLKELKGEVEDYFYNTYGASTDFFTTKITTGRGLLLKFHIGDKLNLEHPSKQVHVKIDLNYFIAPKTVIERRPITSGQLSFVVVTYNMSSLMASKIAAIFQRGTRGVDKEIYEEKGRDIYDLLWYMNKKIVPDFDYLIAKGIDVKNPRALFGRLTLKMNKVNDKNLKQDLLPLFVNKTFIENWLKNWRESYLHLLDLYQIRKVTSLSAVGMPYNDRQGILSFIFAYATEEGPEISVEYKLSDYWIKCPEGDLTITVDDKVVKHMTKEARTAKGKNIMKQKQYATLLYNKTEAYFIKTNRIMLGDRITTKLIRLTADNLNPKIEIFLDKSTLLSCELDDLLA